MKRIDGFKALIFKPCEQSKRTELRWSCAF
uniref:Uncharacterized protein n=1 Tax=Anguilla anguilla TaxID=7936 RepID=A0A0E9PGY6_ANGAN